jgi:hypothetical protein
MNAFDDRFASSPAGAFANHSEQDAARLRNLNAGRN